MKNLHLLFAVLLSFAPAAWPVLAAPPQTTVTTPAPGPVTSSHGKHVVHPATTDDSPPAQGASGSPGTDPNGSNNGQAPNGNSNGQDTNDGYNGADSGGGNPGSNTTDE